jgi:hypothetical protein
MTNEEAKFILSAYRSGGGDAADPMFAQALQQTQTDPALRDWFARKQGYDSAVAAKLKQIEPPSGLRDAILAGARASAKPRSAFRMFTWVGIAAAAAAVALLVIPFRLSRTTSAANQLVEFAINDTAFADHEAHGDVSSLQAMLGDRNARLATDLRLDLDKVRAKGCRTVSVAGEEVFEVCFSRDGKWFHLYVARTPDRPTATDRGMILKQENKFACATWVDASSGVRYAVVSDQGLDAVKSLL